MQEPNNNAALNISLELVQSLEVIHYFLPKNLEKESWELIHYAISSDEACDWTSQQRSDRLFFYRKLTELAPALAVVDEKLRPLFLTD